MAAIKATILETPYGGTFDSSDLVLLRQMASHGFIRWSDKSFQLASGGQSHVYVSGREDLTDNPEFEWAVGGKIRQAVIDNTRVGKPCLIGVPMAGGVLAQAATLVNCQSPAGITHRVMRTERKTHGVHKGWIDGKFDPDRTYWLVENVATTGQSIIEAANRAAEDGYPGRNMPVLIFVDRGYGAVERLTKAGFARIVVVYKLLDLVFTLWQIGLWSLERLGAVIDEGEDRRALTRTELEMRD